MINQQNSIAANLFSLRKINNFTQEEIADKIGVSRQAIAKWENGESTPDIIHCDALAALYGVTLDDLIHYNEKKSGLPIPPKGKHIFGIAKLGERGQIVLPKQARDLFHLKGGDSLVVLADENPETAGIALVPSEFFLAGAAAILKKLDNIQEEDD